MYKETVVGVISVVTIATIIAIVRYKKLNAGTDDIEKVFVDELNMGEIKAWFKNKLVNNDCKGVICYPTKENTEKWGISLADAENVLVQVVYDVKKDKISAYREISFSEISDKVKDMLDNKGGTVIIDK